MRYIFLVLLIIASIIHLYHSYRDDQDKRKYTKGFLLPLIMLYYIFSIKEPNYVLLCALFFSFLGDVLLIPKGNKWFTLGGISFGIGHIMFVCVYLTQINFPVVRWYVVIPLALIYYVVSLVIIFKLKPTTPKKMIIPMYVYLLTNSTMNLFAMMQLHSNPCVGSIVAYIGALFFFISDSTLYIVRYYKNPNVIFKKHFTVMATYILGEFMIVQGIIMLSYMG